MTKDTLRLIELLEKRGMHETAARIEGYWKEVAAKEVRIETLKEDLEEARYVNANYKAAYERNNPKTQDKTPINIVDQLRIMGTSWYFCSMDTANVLIEAAKEIEKLRQENYKLRSNKKEENND